MKDRTIEFQKMWDAISQEKFEFLIETLEKISNRHPNREAAVAAFYRSRKDAKNALESLTQ